MQTVCVCTCVCRDSRGFITRQTFRDFITASTPRGALASPSDTEALQVELDAEFDSMDANGDGVVTLEEFRHALSAR